MSQETVYIVLYALGGISAMIALNQLADSRSVAAVLSLIFSSSFLIGAIHNHRKVKKEV